MATDPPVSAPAPTPLADALARIAALENRDRILTRAGWQGVTAIRTGRVFEIKSPLILQPGPAALTDGLDAIVTALWG